ncbi:MAG TPA: oligosaccharide flippase family protein [Chitinophagaceae bacterium]
MNSKSQNIRNSIWNIIDVILYPITFLATTSFFIDRLGEQVFGLWMLLNSLLIAFQVFNFGLSTSTVRFVAQFKHLNQAQRLKIVINTNLSVSILLFILSILLGFIISWNVKNNNLFDLPLQLRHTASTAIQITCIIIGLKFIEQIFLNAFKGLNRFDTYALLNGIIRFGTLGINIIQLFFYQSLVTMLITNLLITVVMLIVQFFLLRKNVKDYTMRFFFRKKFLKETGQFGLLTWVQSVAVIIVFQLDKYLVITYYGPEELGKYAITATIFVNIHTALTACVTWLIPKLIKYKESMNESRQLYITMRAFITILSIITLSVFYIVHQPFFNLWIGADRFGKIKEYIKLFTVFEFFYMLIIAPPLYLNYSNNVRSGTLVILLTSILNIAGILAGYFFYNSITGILYGLIISTIIADILVYSIMYKIVLQRKLFWEVFVFLGFSVLASTLVTTGSYILQSAILAGIIVLLYLAFIKKERFSLNALFE